MVTTITKGERTRQALVDAAILRFGRDGWGATSVSRIARDVGITPGSVYAHFPGKRALFLTAIDTDADRLIGRAVEAVGPDFVADWTSLLTLLLGSVDDHPLARRVLSGAEGTAADRLLVLPAEARLRLRLTDRLRVAQSQGLVRADIQPQVVADGLTTLLIALLIAALQTGGGTVGADRIDGVAAVLEASLHGPPRVA